MKVGIFLVTIQLYFYIFEGVNKEKLHFHRTFYLIFKLNFLIEIKN